MADENFLPVERPPTIPALARGTTRTSVTVELANLPSVARRRELNDRLLDHTCGFMPADGRFVFTADDLGLLLLVTHERFGSTSSLLRRQAVSALGQLDDDPAVARLRELVMSPVEHDQVRLTALTALTPDRSARMYDELLGDSSEVIREHVRRLTGAAQAERRATPGQVRLDPEVSLRDGHDPRTCHCCS